MAGTRALRSLSSVDSSSATETSATMVSRSASSRGIPASISLRSISIAVRADTRQKQHEACGVEPSRGERPLVGTPSPGTCARSRSRAAETFLITPSSSSKPRSVHQCSGRVDAREHRSGRARGMAGLEPTFEPVEVETSVRAHTRLAWV